jgi:cell wall-associated NlpC family hydrolase
MTEQEFRTSIVEAAKLWLGTPYKNNGRIRGVGANCAQLLFGVAKDAKAIPADAPEPRWYSSQFHVHQADEKLIDYVKAYGATEITEEQVKSGDIIICRTGQSHGHAAIVIDYPEIMVHTLQPHGCQYGHCTKEGILAGKRRRYFTLWKTT